VRQGSAVLYRPALKPLSTNGDFSADTVPLSPTSRNFGPLEVNGRFVHPRRDQTLNADDADGLIRGAVEARVEADVPLGCFLSGGVDSSLIASHAKDVLGSLSTFSVRMPASEYDESRFAESAAAVIGTRHTTLDCRAVPCDDLITLIRQIGLPLGDSSLLPATWVSRAAREHVAVALSGDGGDEMFIGYERYLVASRTPQRMPGARALARVLDWRAHPKSRRSKVARYFDASANAGYWDLVSVFPSSSLDRLIADPAARELDRAWSRSRVHTWNTDQAVLLDVCNYLPDDLLRKSEGASMSVALELRSPMLDPDLVQSCMRTRVGSLVPNNQRKGLLRQVARKYLPPEIVDRPKMGFAIPIGEWFRSDYGGLRTMLLDHLNSTEPFGPPSLGIDLNMPFIRQMLDEHLGIGPSGLVKRDHSQRLYMLLVLSIWAKWLGGLQIGRREGVQA